MPDDNAVDREAIERRDGQKGLALQIEEVRADVSAVKADLHDVARSLRVLKRRVGRDVTALTDELAKLNRRALAIALAAVLAALGSVPEARALAAVIVKGLMH